MAVFRYGEVETSWLASRDPRLGDSIEQIGPVEREIDPDLFSSIMHHIIGQQISTKAQATIWRRMCERLGGVTPETVLAAGEGELQALGMTFRKAGYLMEFARRIETGAFDLAAVARMPDEEAIRALDELPGIGRWTAEMVLLFCLERPNVLSWDDLAIQRGMRMLYHHRRITPELFAKYRRRYSPYGSTASLYLWAIAGGAIPGMRDWAPKRKANKSKAGENTA